MRVYLPATSTSVRRLAADGELTGPLGGPLTGFAVTPGLRRWYGEDLGPDEPPPDDEDLEYAAGAEAARASLRLLAGDPTAARRRTVIAADVPDDDVAIRDDLDRGVVRVAAPVLLAVVAAVFVDDEDAETTVALAAAAIDAADLGDVTAQETTDDAEGFELSWFAPTELDGLLGQVPPPDPAG